MSRLVSCRFSSNKNFVFCYFKYKDRNEGVDCLRLNLSFVVFDFM